MAFFRDLSAVLLGNRKAESFTHPTFGEIVLRKGKRGPYWMHDAYDDGELTISIETRDSEPPSFHQVEFFVQVSSDWDSIFAKVAAQVIPKYESYLREPFPARWQAAFRPAGLHIPLDGNPEKHWDVTFECIANNTGFLFSCYFEHGQTVGVTVDT